MFKKTYIYVILLILSIVLLCGGLLIPLEDLKTIQGIIIGIGAGLFGVNIAKIFMINYYKNNPKMMKQNEIELNDERNAFIRYKAKAKSGDITQWFIILIAFIMIIIDAPLWATIITIGVYLLYTILSMYYISKYNKSM